MRTWAVIIGAVRALGVVTALFTDEPGYLLGLLAMGLVGVGFDTWRKQT